MSRNLRHQTAATPVKKSKRRASNVSLTSSDSDYDAVDNISGSDEDEPDVESAEERAIIEEHLDSNVHDEDLLSPRPSTYSDYENWEGFEESPMPPEHTFFDDHIERGRQPDLASEAATSSLHVNWVQSRRSSDSDSTVTPHNRQVHFEDDDSNDSDIERQFPDIFFDQNSLNPSFRNAIEQDNDEANISSDGGRWSFGSDDTGSLDENRDDSGSLSGYSTDSEGDSWILGDSDVETDEEETPQHAVAPVHSILRRTDSSGDSDASTSTEEITPARRPRGPRLGTWKHDRTKPFIIYDGKRGKLLMFRAQPEPANGDGPIASSAPASPAPTPVEMSPMLSNSANLMMSGMTTNAFGRGQIDQFGEGFAPIEAFFPFVSVSNSGVVTHDSSSNDFDDDDEFGLDDENLWNVEDFIDFNGESSSIEEDPSPSSDTAEPMSTPAQATSIRSEEQVHPLLTHFNNPSVVGAFRNNQRRHQLLTRENQSQDSLAFSGPLQQGTLKGIKGGRLAQANKPITPRRKTLQQPMGSSPGSPLANVGAMKKRKFGGEDFMGHKRHHSAV